MPADALIDEADRLMTICNACRYCEGYCAVFPAMEKRRTFAKDDLIYMANLCFDCRACYYACPYTPPHEYAINVPEVFANLRAETYQDFSAPGFMARAFQGSRVLVGFAVVAVVAIMFAVAIALRGATVVFEEQGADFFAVVPYWAMVAPALALTGYWVLVLVAGAMRFWRETGGSAGELVSAGAFLKAMKDAFGLAYLRGGGDGCFYPDERPSYARVWYHHLVFFGFLLDLAATTVAAFYHNILGWHSPYALLSVPVVLGTVGGVMLVIGTVGLLWMKWRADRDPSYEHMLNMDVIFLGLLFGSALSGLVLLAWRDTAAMGTLLLIHLGIVAVLFITMPYGKFAHVAYRYAALVKNQIEVAADADRPAAARSH
ncbi:MAG: tricarballylate utilization 4Fe-4S protein TcuB [Dehalococcoidia bacterium]